MKTKTTNPTAKHDPEVLRRVKVYCAANGLFIQDVYDRLATQFLDQVEIGNIRVVKIPIHLITLK